MVLLYFSEYYGVRGGVGYLGKMYCTCGSES